MYRLDNSTAATAIPTPGSVGPNPNGFFTDGVPGVTPNTIVPADWLNAVQEEISYAVTQSGQTLSKTNRGQLWTSITSLFSTFHAVTGARVAGTIYTNSTGKPMFVVVNFSSVGNAGVSLLVNGNTTSQVIFPVGGGNSTLYGVVPAGGTYQLVNVTYAITITGWGETW